MFDDWLADWLNEWVNEWLIINPLGTQNTEYGLEILELQSGRDLSREKILHFENFADVAN